MDGNMGIVGKKRESSESVVVPTVTHTAVEARAWAGQRKEIRRVRKGSLVIWSWKKNYQKCIESGHKFFPRGKKYRKDIERSETVEVIQQDAP